MLDPGRVLIIGAGPAGLTAASELADHGVSSTILESDDVVGGISRTVEKDGWRFDIGGHRFFTKVRRVEDFWHDTLPDEDFLMRPRMSRIYYDGKFYDYPLKAANALRNLGLLESIRCVLSYAAARVRPPRDQATFEGWVAGRFGWRLYRTFFKTYTEKVWGIPADHIGADWAAQRIKNLSLGKAVARAVLPSRKSRNDITSLIEEFQYPKYGPGMMWEVCADKVLAFGSTIHFGQRVTSVTRASSGNLQIGTSTGQSFDADRVISTMPINALVNALQPSPPVSVLHAANRLKHRDFLTVALVVPLDFSFPDNWIYIHDPKTRVGRIQNYGSWSPYLVKDGRTCLGMEYFVDEGDDLWSMDDDALIKFATDELAQLELAKSEAVEHGYVVRYPKTYPVYDTEYSDNLAAVRDFLASEWPEIHPVGRNGMHRYNNQDHSMLTAMLTVDNIVLGTSHDVWNVNVEAEYHEESGSVPESGTGRAAPTFR